MARVLSAPPSGGARVLSGPGATPLPGGVPKAPTVPESVGTKVKKFAEDALPTAGAIVGGIAGSVGGAAVGGPVGGFAGGVAGSGAGAAAGEAAKEKLQGAKLSAGKIATQGAEFGALEAVGGPVASLAGKAIKGVGKTVAEAVIPKSMQEAGALQTYNAAKGSVLDRVGAFVEKHTPSVKDAAGAAEKAAGTATKKLTKPVTAGATAFRKAIMGTESMMGVQAKRAQTKMWDKIIEPALKAHKGEIDMPAFFKEAEAKIAGENNDPTRRNMLMNALNAVKEDFKGVEKISAVQLQKYKEGWAEFVPEKAYKGQPIAGALNDVRNTLASHARGKIYDIVGPEAKQAYIDYGNMHALKELGKKATAGGAIKAGGTFTGLKGLWEMATVPAGTIGGQVVYKVGQGIELLGAPGARTVRDILLGATNGSGDTSIPAPAPQQQPPATEGIVPG